MKEWQLPGLYSLINHQSHINLKINKSFNFMKKLEKCPSCERKFEAITDYPRVYVAKVERFELPSKATYLAYDFAIYSGHKYPKGNRMAPKHVLDFFRDNPEAHVFEDVKEVWRKDAEYRYRQERLALLDRIKIFFGIPKEKIIPFKSFELATYIRMFKRTFSIADVLTQLNPYFKQLESIVGQEVPIKDALPEQYNGQKNLFEIQHTPYQLFLEELTEPTILMLKNRRLPVPNLLDVPEETKKTAFIVVRSSEDVTAEINPLAVLGGMAYEGRINAQSNH